MEYKVIKSHLKTTTTDVNNRTKNNTRQKQILQVVIGIHNLEGSQVSDEPTIFGMGSYIFSKKKLTVYHLLNTPKKLEIPRSYWVGHAKIHSIIETDKNTFCIPRWKYHNN